MKATQLPIIIKNATAGHKLQDSGVDTLFVHNWSYVTNCLTLFSHGLKLDQDFSAENHLAMIYNSILYHYRSHECCKISQLFLLAIGVKRNMMNYLVTTFAFHDLFMTTLCLPMAAFQSSHLPVVTIPQESSHLVPLSTAPLNHPTCWQLLCQSSHMVPLLAALTESKELSAFLTKCHASWHHHLQLLYQSLRVSTHRF